MSKILVTGATGRLGSQVVNYLLKNTSAENVSIFVRDASKAAEFEKDGVKVLTGDYTDFNSLSNAFKGVDKLYMVSGNDLVNRTTQHQNVINVAKEAGIKHVLYTSFQHKTENPDSMLSAVSQSHLETEKHLVASGLTYTILQHALYADIIPDFAGEHVLENHTIFFPAGNGKTAFATAADMAQAGAIVLLDDTGKYDNQFIEIAGSEALSWSEIAELISKIAGQDIKYVSPEIQVYQETLTKAGLPPFVADMLSGFGDATAKGEFDSTTGELEKILGRKPVSVAGFLESVYKK